MFRDPQLGQLLAYVVPRRQTPAWVAVEGRPAPLWVIKRMSLWEKPCWARSCTTCSASAIVDIRPPVSLPSLSSFLGC